MTKGTTEERQPDNQTNLQAHASFVRWQIHLVPLPFTHISLQLALFWPITIVYPTWGRFNTTADRVASPVRSRKATCH